MTIERIEAFKNGYNNGFITNEIRDAFWLSVDSLMAHNAMLYEAVESDGLLDHLGACEIGKSATKVPPKRSVYDALSNTKERVAEVGRLKVAEQSYCRRISSLETQIKSLQRSAAIRDTKLIKAKAHADLIKAENERLKQAAALFREASFQGHSSHWDSQGTSGANCPACSKASNLRRQADDLLSQPPKEAT